MLEKDIALTAKKKERILTEAEIRRLDAFNATCDELAAQGYKRTNLDINIVTANIVAIVAVVVLFLVLLPLFNITHPDGYTTMSAGMFIILVIIFLVLIVAHELVHGLTWSFFAPNGFADIEFGIMRDSFTPYCTCKTPLRKSAYILGALMPLIVFGLLLIAIAFIGGFLPFLYLGICMTVAAMGDIMIVLKVLRYKSASEDVLLYDHPTEAGSVIFER